jgi:hypothetical protein
MTRTFKLNNENRKDRLTKMLNDFVESPQLQNIIDNILEADNKRFHKSSKPIPSISSANSDHLSLPNPDDCIIIAGECIDGLCKSDRFDCSPQS